MSDCFGVVNCLKLLEKNESSVCLSWMCSCVVINVSVARYQKRSRYGNSSGSKELRSGENHPVVDTRKEDPCNGRSERCSRGL